MDERRRRVLEVATRLFTEHGVHAVGMDRLVEETGLAKMSVYRVFPTKDDLVGAYLQELAVQILDLVDRDIARAATPADALHAVLDGVAADLRRPGFRGCPFGNAAAEFDDPDHAARRTAREYRQALLDRLDATARRLDPVEGRRLARRLAALVDGAYLSTAHLGPDGPGAEAVDLAHELVDAVAASARG
ncbi:TetR/AcrR family transcriptional regulator [Phycicoccus flavus]|uniref:TetR/AcrR family transcriptional regulator n=1 Tax=Phycicoccus flavus TaxID=2502783 RepID=A0A8T6R749_9MICO|nr:TetR/AcrR family transcriptional regulator [Phycicoccus flavus]NHA69686.1 TetR/AcrR family transcriptional regulator [Phycicoccus flavus]